MAIAIRRAGASAETVGGVRRRVQSALAAFFMAGGLALLFVPAWWADAAGGGPVGAAAVFIGTLLWATRGPAAAAAEPGPDEQRLPQPIAPEVQIANLLTELPSDYVVFSDFGGELEHIVVAPHGVFVLETKPHRGQLSSDGAKLLLNGRPLPKRVMRQVMSDALWLRDVIREGARLEIFVQPVLVFTEAWAPCSLAKPRGVLVADTRRLLPALMRTSGAAIAMDEVLETLLPLSGVEARRAASVLRGLRPQLHHSPE